MTPKYCSNFGQISVVSVIVSPCQWHGQYEVTRVIWKVNYEIEMPE